MLLSPERSTLVVVDVQERLAPAIHEAGRVIRNAGILLDSAGALGIPVLASEQYPRGLGATVPALRERLPADAVVEKIHFACTGEPGFVQRLDAFGRDQIVVCGMEAHVCVLQTVLGLRAMGRAVTLVADAVSSRAPANAELAIARMRAHGVEIVSTEMVVFEWLQRAGTPVFKTLSTLIK
ncbi:MAG TPA: hydrolase [Azospirillum sp.]|nr:hydrolase [Azospirillum sp.]